MMKRKTSRREGRITRGVVANEVNEDRLEIVFEIVTGDLSIVRTNLIGCKGMRNGSKENLTLMPRFRIVFVEKFDERPFVILKEFDKQGT